MAVAENELNTGQNGCFMPMPYQAEKGVERRDEHGRFVKGHTVGGRPSLPAECKAYLKEITLPTLKRLFELVKQGKSPTVAERAARTVLAYAVGLPVQQVDVAMRDDTDMAARLRALLAQAAGEPIDVECAEVVDTDARSD